ncbi:MAG: hypothetical protein S4CHLAM20_01800 [Chlamydiia bacterium]|nr:hypothetical protein [Chlamydiia bacterium]
MLKQLTLQKVESLNFSTTPTFSNTTTQSPTIKQILYISIPIAITIIATCVIVLYYKIASTPLCTEEEALKKTLQGRQIGKFNISVITEDNTEEIKKLTKLIDLWINKAQEKFINLATSQDIQSDFILSVINSHQYLDSLDDEIFDHDLIQLKNLKYILKCMKRALGPEKYNWNIIINSKQNGATRSLSFYNTNDNSFLYLATNPENIHPIDDEIYTPGSAKAMIIFASIFSSSIGLPITVDSLPTAIDFYKHVGFVDPRCCIKRDPKSSLTLILPATKTRAFLHKFTSQPPSD